MDDGARPPETGDARRAAIVRIGELCGFHDATLAALIVDYRNGRLTFEIDNFFA